MVLLVVALTGCGKEPVSTVTAPSKLSLLQENKYITAELYGVMTFSFSDTTFSWPAVLDTSSVPIVWMGQVFNGKIGNAGPGKDMTEQVHGGVSADGEWLLSFAFSRGIVGPNGFNVFYSVELKNVPIAVISIEASGEPGSFSKEGDVQKYVSQVVYVSPGTSYISTDWTNDLDGQRPKLKLAFEKEPSKTLGGPSQPQPQAGM